MDKQDDEGGWIGWFRIPDGDQSVVGKLGPSTAAVAALTEAEPCPAQGRGATARLVSVRTWEGLVAGFWGSFGDDARVAADKGRDAVLVFDSLPSGWRDLLPRFGE